MPTPITFGMAIFTNGDFLDEAKQAPEVEIAERRGTNGDIARVHEYNRTADFSYKGGGNPATALGVAADAMSGLSGGVQMNKKYELTNGNTNFDDFNVDGKHYPNATRV